VHLHLSRWWPDPEMNRHRPDLTLDVPSLLREMDAAGIAAGNVIQLHEAPSEAAIAEGRSLAAQSDGRLRPVVTVDPTRGAPEVQATVARWESEPGLVGVKLFPGYLPFYPHDPRLAPVFEFAHRRGVPVMIHQGDTLDRAGRVKFARPIEVDEVAVRYPDVTFVLCHFGNPWMEEAAEIVYKNANVYADTSGLLAPPTAHYFEKMVERCRRRLFNAIVTVGAPDRILYGSDWPLEALATAVDLVDGLDLPLEDRDAILGGNARRLFRSAAPDRTSTPPPAAPPRH
jgi:predicted TIM-barrel fold metal-dependent hydrolase